MRRGLLMLVICFAGSPPVRAQHVAVEPPRLGQPADFSQLVGVFQITVRANPTSVAVEGPITLTVTITGQASAPYLPKQERLQLFPSEMQRDFYVEPTAERAADGAWQFDFRLRPKHPQVQVVPGLKLVYYAPRQRRYQTAYTDAIPLTVKPRPETVVDAKGVNFVQAPASFLELAIPTAAPRSPVLYFSPYQEIGLIVAPPLVCLLGAWWWRTRRKPDAQLSRRRRRAIAQAMMALADAGPDAVAKTQMVTDYLRLRLALPMREPTPAEIDRWLKRCGVSRDLRQRWRQFLQASDAIRYAPADATTARKALDHASPLIQALEEEPCLAGH